jgi:4-hydroxyacetophenone monooxygenase
MDSAIDTQFLRRAVEFANLDAVRVALFQQTGDPEIQALPVAAKLDPARRELLILKAVDWLENNATDVPPAEPSPAELRKLMNMATGVEMGDLEFDARRDLPAFRPFPFFAKGWSDARPPLPEGFRVVIIGSGISGIAAGVQCELLGVPYTVLERRSEAGGTWTINRYPDVRVDTHSIIYEYNFEKDYPWTEYFGRGAEVRAYLDHVSRKFGVFANTRFDADVKQATFDEARNIWTLRYQTPGGIETIEANVIISASGLFANPRIPQFEGRDSFAGRIVHPSAWPADLDLTGKRVAVIGNGSTGVQILGTIARTAGQVHVFQRTPQWISPREKYGQPLEPEIVWLLKNFPGYWNWWRYMQTAGLFETHAFLLSDPEWQAQGGKVNPRSDALRDFLTHYIKTETGGREDLIARLTPDYAPFSRRPVVDNGWYRALTRDNVELVTDDIARFTPRGIETADGTLREVDVIVTATGFDIVKFLWPARYAGKNGRDLHDMWNAADGPRAYLGMMVPEFPNFFMIYGPNSQPLSGGTSLHSWYAVWAGYAAQCIARMVEQGKSRVEVKREAYERYNAALDEAGAELILMKKEGGVEKNYYVNNEHGHLQVSAPWLSQDFHRMCAHIDWDDLEIS